MLFLKNYAFGKCIGITFADSTMIPVYHNLRRYSNKVFKELVQPFHIEPTLQLAMS